MIKKYIRSRTFWAAWLGAALTFVGFPFYTWQFWFVFLPTLVIFLLQDGL
jgi:hypothetical protein